MTNEEHIEQLKKLRSFHNGSYGRSINKAIEALKKEKDFDYYKSQCKSYEGTINKLTEAIKQEPKIPCDLCQYQGEVCMCEYCSATPINENYGMREGET